MQIMANFENILFPILTYLASSVSLCFSLKFEGSKISYAKYPPWIPCQNGTISFEFQTEIPSGLLLYTDDGRKLDYFLLKLVNGLVNLKFKLDDSQIPMMSGQKVNDNKWHTVEIQRDGRFITLKVDNLTNTKELKSSDLDFGGNSSWGNYVFIGGMPLDYNSKLADLAYTPVMFENPLIGSIRNLFYGDCGTALKAPKLIDSNGIITDKDVCLQKNPCQNGGVCITRDQDVKCDCTHTQYEGKFCEEEKKPVEVTLTGTQYLTYYLDTKGSQIFSNKDQLSLHFRTQHPDGLLFFTGEGKDFMTVFLMNGAVAVVIDLGSGAYSTVTDLNGYKLDDNHWHHLVVHRESREITIQIDGLIRATGSTEGKFTMLSSSILYVGGSSSTRTLPGSRIFSNFKGCLKQVQYSADNIKFDLTELAKTGHTLIRVVGEIQFGQCQEEVQTKPITFTTTKSFIALPRWELQKEFGTIAFRFKTTEPTGLLIYNSDSYDVSKRDFFALEIVDGYFYLVLELGSGVTKVKASRTKVDDGKEHDVLFQYRGQEGYINIDGDKTDYISPGNSKQLDLTQLLYIGGVDFERLGAHRLPKEVWSGTLGYGYVGCFQDLVINNVRIDLLSLAIKQGQKGVADQCRTREDHCGSRPCLHNGVCKEGWNRYMCKCAGTAYTGSSCQDAAVTIKFDGVQHMKIDYPEESETEIEDISLRFHTIRSDAILLLTASEIYPDMYEVYLEGGTVKVTINLGNRAKTLIIGQGLNDDQWHTLYLQRRGQDILINIDDNRPVLDVISSIITTLHVSTILLGSVGPMLSDDLAASSQTSDFNLVDAGVKVQNDNQIRHHKGFIGAMQNFIWNGQQYFEMAKQGRVQNLEMTARYDDGESVILDPVTFKSTASYVVLSQLKADTYFSVSFMFKTLGPNGLILFNGISDYDYLALELHNGYLYYSYDVGGGSQRIYVNTAEPLNDNKWHDVSLIRPMKEKQIIRVDNFPATVENMDRNSPTDFNLKGPLYLGGVQKTMYISLPANIKSGHGFQGCMATLDINGHKYNILRDAINVEYSVTVGCKESGISCQPSSCFNGGRCVQQWNSYVCDCEMTSYTGPTCNDVSTTYRFALGKGLITFEHGEGKDVSTNSDYLAFGFKTIQHNANLVRVDSSSGDDYIEMQLAGGNLVVAYNMGKLEHPIGEFYHKVNDGAYHVVRFTRSGPNATLQIDTWPQQTKTPAGDQMSVFNNQARVWIGGRKDSRGQINNGFIGTMSGFVFNSHHVFDMLVNGDPQVTKEGDVTLLPHNKSKMENDPEAMQSTQGIKHHLDKRSNRKEESSIRNIFSQVPTKASYSNNLSGRRKSGKWQDDNSIKKIGKKSSDKYLNGHFVQNNANTKFDSTHDIFESTVGSTTSQRNYILEGSLDVVESNFDQSEIDNRDTVQEHSGYPLDGSGFMETGYHDMENYMTGKKRDQSAKASRHSRLSPEWTKLKQVHEYYIKNENIPESSKILLGTFQNSPLAIDLRDTSKTSKFPKDRGKGWKEDYKIQQLKHSSTTPTQLTSDDIISSSGMGPECFKQEDDECISEALAPTDEIITASIIVHRTTTLRPDLNQSQDISMEPCDDEDKECPFSEGIQRGKLTTSVSPTDTYSPEQAREKKSGTGEINIALIIGVTAGVVVALIILLVALYKFRSREEGSYKVDESQNFAYLESKKQPSNGALVNHNGSGKVGKKKDVKEWYV